MVRPSLFVQHLRVVAGNVRRSALVAPRTQEERNTRMLYLNTAMIGIAAGGIASFLPVFLARLGADSTLIGWLTSAPALVSIFFLLPGAMLAERYVDQVKVRCVASRLSRGPYLLCALVPFFVPAQYLPLVLVLVWMLKTIPEAVSTPAWTSVIARAVSPRRRAQLNGTRWALLSLVSALSSAFFGWLLDRIRFPLNYQLVFLLSFATAVLDPYFFSFIRVEPLMRPQAGASGDVLRRARDYFRPVLQHRPFLVLIGATLLYRVALSLPSPLFSLFWVNNLHASDTLIGLRGTVGHAALVAGYIAWGRSANRVGHRRLLALSALAFALYPLLTALSPSQGWLLPAAAVWGLTAAGIDIGLFDLMLACCPTERQPLFAAVYSIVASSAIFVGPLLGAALANSTSTATALVVAAMAQVITTLPFVFLPRDV